MNFLNNKHVITALIVAPIMAIASYYLVDLVVKEQPQKAIAGQAYKLVAKSNCRYSSGACDLENGSFKSTVTVVGKDDGNPILVLNANNSLQQASIGFVSASGTESGPFALKAHDDSNKIWSTELSVTPSVNTVIRVALTANDAHYFSETTMGFSNYETSFNKDFRKEN